jgi:uncharacterized protein YggE
MSEQNLLPPPAIEATASAMRQMAADIAEVHFDITSTDKQSAQAALDATGHKLTMLLAAINKQFGKIDIIRNNNTLMQRTTEPGDRNTKPVFLHHESKAIVTFETREIERIGILLAAIAATGGAQIENVEFKLSEARKSALIADAVAAATRTAMLKATTVAETLKVKLGNVRRASENTYESGNNMPRARYAYAAETSAEAEKTDIAVVPNQININTTITLVFDIEQ